MNLIDIFLRGTVEEGGGGEGDAGRGGDTSDDGEGGFEEGMSDVSTYFTNCTVFGHTDAVCPLELQDLHFVFFFRRRSIGIFTFACL